MRAAREHNLKNIDVEIPRNALVVLGGVSRSGKSSLALGTLHAQAQRCYLESVSPYARRRLHQMPVPEGDAIDGLPPVEARRTHRCEETLSYQGTFTGARKYVLQTFAAKESAILNKRVAQYLVSMDGPLCEGRRRRKEALSVIFAGHANTATGGLSLWRLAELLQPHVDGVPASREKARHHLELAIVTQRIAADLPARQAVLLDTGQGYLSLKRGMTTLPPGQLQRLRLATQVRASRVGVAHVAGESPAGLHPADMQALLRALERLTAAGNWLFVVKHRTPVLAASDGAMLVGPGAGEEGGRIVLCATPADVAACAQRHSAPYRKRALAGVRKGQTI